jgi:uncharacterized metal-binding protein YceD (DUF177 family)
MSDLNSFVINFAGLKNGNHKFNFNIDNKFFEGFDYFDFKSADIECKLDLEKQATVLSLLFNINGNIVVPCDVSMELFEIPVLSNFNLAVKFGNRLNDEGDEILILPHGSHQINVSQYIFEIVVLKVPLKKVHPGIKDGSLNSDISNRLKLLEPKEKKNSSEHDSRWDKLKELL